MPQEGTAILSQIRQLMDQFLAVDYDSPVKDRIEAMIPEVEAGLSELSSQEGVGEGTEPQGPPVQGSEALTAPEERPSDFRGARDAAMSDIRASGGFPTRRSVEAEDQTDPRKKKKVKAPY